MRGQVNEGSNQAAQGQDHGQFPGQNQVQIHQQMMNMQGRQMMDFPPPPISNQIQNQQSGQNMDPRLLQHQGFQKEPKNMQLSRVKNEASQAEIQLAQMKMNWSLKLIVS